MHEILPQYSTAPPSSLATDVSVRTQHFIDESLLVSVVSQLFYLVVFKVDNNLKKENNTRAI